MLMHSAPAQPPPSLLLRSPSLPDSSCSSIWPCSPQSLTFTHLLMCILLSCYHFLHILIPPLCVPLISPPFPLPTYSIECLLPLLPRMVVPVSVKVNTPSLKHFHKSGASALTSSPTLLSDPALVSSSFSFQTFLLSVASFLTTFFTFSLTRSVTTSLYCSSPAMTFISPFHHKILTSFLPHFSPQFHFLHAHPHNPQSSEMLKRQISLFIFIVKCLNKGLLLKTLYQHVH